MATKNTKTNVAPAYSTFYLAGCKWTVSLSKDITEMGTCNPVTYEIILKENMSPQAIEATFFHELVHAIKFTMGETGHDEREVEAFGNLLHQTFVQLWRVDTSKV
jgi:hypothetical protein